MSKRIARCCVCWPPSPEADKDTASAADTGTEVGRPASYGVMKPDIVFFGEALPDSFYTSLEEDLPQVCRRTAGGEGVRVMRNGLGMQVCKQA